MEPIPKPDDSMRLRIALLLFTLILIGSIPACNCGGPYITSPEADATATDIAPRTVE